MTREAYHQKRVNWKELLKYTTSPQGLMIAERHEVDTIQSDNIKALNLFHIDVMMLQAQRATS